MEANLKVIAKKAGALVLKSPFLTDANIVYRTVKAGEQVGLTIGVSRPGDPVNFEKIVVAIPQGNPFSPDVEWLYNYYYVPDDESFSFLAFDLTEVIEKETVYEYPPELPSGEPAPSQKDDKGNDVITAPGGATIEVWKTLPRQEEKSKFPLWAIWALAGLAVVALISVTYSSLKKPKSKPKR